MVEKGVDTSSLRQEPNTGVKAKAYCSPQRSPANSKVAMSRGVSALEAFRHIPPDILEVAGAV